MADYITTYTKIHFTPLEPREEDIRIEDIAHALSMMTRANGHFSEFYSVAQHCIYCSEEAKARGDSKRIQLACLLHDASEAYLADITRPVKKCLIKYLEIEDILQSAIYKKYLQVPMIQEEQQQVKLIDDTLLYYEFEHYMGEKLQDIETKICSTPVFKTVPFLDVEKRYLTLFNKLAGNEVVKKISIGVDGCKRAWIAVKITDSDFEICKYSNINDLCEMNEDADSLLIDMPIGLPENSNEESLRPDAKLRKLLTYKAPGIKTEYKGSSVFNIPCRQAVYAKSKDEIIKANQAILGKGIAEQSIAILPKIRELDEFLNKNNHWKNRIKESHPEVAFCVLNGGRPIMENKATDEGANKRIELLMKYYPYTNDVVVKFYTDGGTKGILNDLLDALCLAVVGLIGMDRNYKTIPEHPQQDSRGLLMQVVVPDLNIK